MGGTLTRLFQRLLPRSQRRNKRGVSPLACGPIAALEQRQLLYTLQNFDGADVTVPAIPTGWTQSNRGGHRL